LGIWDRFIGKCEVTISKIVADEAKWASREFEDIRIDLEPYGQQGRITIIDVEPPTVAQFYEDAASISNRYDIHSGEQEILAFSCTSKDDWLICAADKAVFRVLGFLGKGDVGVSLEEVLQKIGLSAPNLEWKYTKKFREKFTSLGQVDAVQEGYIP
jgi:hypothetical protein